PAGAQPAATPQSVSGAPSATPAAARAQVHGMWVWSTKTRLEDAHGLEALLASCRTVGVDEVYLSTNNGVLDDPRLPRFVGGLEAAGIRVEALFGDATWYRPAERAPMVAMIEAVAGYGRAHPEAAFAGIHLDIEPHQLPANRGKHDVFMPELIATLTEATALATRHGLTSAADLPRFAFDENGPAVARSVGRSFVMLYQLREKTPQWLTLQSGKVMKNTFAGLPPDVGGRLVVGVRVEDYPEDLEGMVQALDAAKGGGESGRYGGWAIHDEAKYRARKAARGTPISP
ncbi:MAG: hypothetical protein JWP97_3571, partial [Labilithrix sp.]|nr:hypothetical protein [Labilithrix sp.]